MSIENPSEDFESAIGQTLKEICDIKIAAKYLLAITHAIGDTFGLEKKVHDIATQTGTSVLQSTLHGEISLDRQAPIRSGTDQAEGYMELAAMPGTMSINQLLASAAMITKDKRIAQSATVAVLQAAIDTFLDAHAAFVESMYSDVMIELGKVDNGALLKSAVDLENLETGGTPPNRDLVALYLINKLESEMDISDRLDAKFLGT